MELTFSAPLGNETSVSGKVSMNHRLANIALITNSQVRFLLIAIARKLKTSYGSRIHLFCKSPQEASEYTALNSDGLFDSITNMEVMFQALDDPLVSEEEVLTKARRYEAKLETTYNLIAVSNRHFGRGYALGGFYHPRSRWSERCDYARMLHGFNEVFDFWERQIQEKSISLFLGGTKETAVIACSHGIPMRSLFRSRYQSYHYWTPNEYRDHPRLEEAYRSIAAPSVPAVELKDTYLDERARRQRWLKNMRWSKVLHDTGYYCARWVYWKAKGYQKAEGYFLSDTVRLVWRRKRDLQRMTGAETKRLVDLEGKRFVFYPLHTEPELALGLISPEFYFQLTAISALSRDLPAGTILAVKESITGVGRRPDNFYSQILNHKNVVMLNILEQGYEVVRRASAVATISGTAGFEAAVQGIPVISFGRHNSYNFLPHVSVIDDLGRLGTALDKALGSGFDREKAQQDGARFLDAVVQSSFDLGGYDYFNLTRFSDEAVENACNALEQSLKT